MTAFVLANVGLGFHWQMNVVSRRACGSVSEGE